MKQKIKMSITQNLHKKSLDHGKKKNYSIYNNNMYNIKYFNIIMLMVKY